uniref:Uncharacterized protein n=1 Tax=Romanomermis culicivorax TaxID=13658 RepID=A0A915IIS3_ROMCU
MPPNRKVTQISTVVKIVYIKLLLIVYKRLIVIMIIFDIRFDRGITNAVAVPFHYFVVYNTIIGIQQRFDLNHEGRTFKDSTFAPIVQLE